MKNFSEIEQRIYSSDDAGQDAISALIECICDLDVRTANLPDELVGHVYAVQKLFEEHAYKIEREEYEREKRQTPEVDDFGIKNVFMLRRWW